MSENSYIRHREGSASIKAKQHAASVLRHQQLLAEVAIEGGGCGGHIVRMHMFEG
jgi:hypothetical protein